ncbi:MAG: helix-turn-helix domain-containing protein [Treponema sp.]
MSFRDRLRKEIEYNDLLIKEISAQVGISNSTFLSYIDARGVLPNVETGVKIAKALGVSVDYLVTGEQVVQD